MLIDRILGIFAFLVFAAFFAVVLFGVRRIDADLVFFIVLGLALAGIDFWISLRPRRNGSR